jgi:hypothetical protein
VAADAVDGGDNLLADLLGELFQLLGGEGLEIGWACD